MELCKPVLHTDAMGIAWTDGFGARLREALDSRGDRVTYSDFGAMVGALLGRKAYSHVSVHNWCHDRDLNRTETFHAILKAAASDPLRINPSWLQHGKGGRDLDDNPPPEELTRAAIPGSVLRDDDERRLIQIYRRLPAAERMILIHMAEGQDLRARRIPVKRYKEQV